MWIDSLLMWVDVAITYQLMRLVFNKKKRFPMQYEKTSRGVLGSLCSCTAKSCQSRAMIFIDSSHKTRLETMKISWENKHQKTSLIMLNSWIPVILREATTLF